MNILSSSSGINLLNAAQQRSENAGKEIAGLTVQKTDGGEIEYGSAKLVKPVLDLKKAELETSAATKIIAANQKAIGAILDIHA